MTLAYVLAGVTMLALNAYVLLGGADFGAGVWDLLARGPRAARQRAAIEQGIGPIWEANHVWVILVVVLLFTCFPPVYAHLSVALHIPISLLLVGIVLRGSAFTFRAYDSTQSPVQKYWGRIFSISSTITPVLLGVCVGALVSGALALPAGESFAATYVAPWFTPFAFAVGGLTLAVFAFLAAVYLCVEVREHELQEDFRRMALGAAVAVGACAALALLLGVRGRLPVINALVTTPWALPFQLVTGALAVASIWALVTRRYRVARVTAVGQVSALMWGWALAQAPALVPGVHTIESAAAPAITLKLVSIGLLGGAAVLVPSLWYLFRVFKSDSTSAFERVDTAEYKRPTLVLAFFLALAATAGVAEAQRAPRLPATFYDVELRGSMLDGAVSRITTGGSNRPVAAPPRGNGIGGGIIVPENSGESRFIIAADSLLFRNGRDVVEVATTDFLAVDEVRGPTAPQVLWVRLRYRHPEGERELFVRRYSTREQGALLAALQAAHRAGQQAAQRAATVPPRDSL